MGEWNALVGAEGPGKTGTVFHALSTPLPHLLPPATPLLMGVLAQLRKCWSAGHVHTSTSSNVGATSKSTGDEMWPGQWWWPLCHPLLKKEWCQLSFGTSQPSYPVSVKTLWNTLSSVNKALSLLTKSHLCPNEKEFVLSILKSDTYSLNGNTAKSRNTLNPTTKKRPPGNWRYFESL